jgi:hypothetical protein
MGVSGSYMETSRGMEREGLQGGRLEFRRWYREIEKDVANVFNTVEILHFGRPEAFLECQNDLKKEEGFKVLLACVMA